MLKEDLKSYEVLSARSVDVLPWLPALAKIHWCNIGFANCQGQEENIHIEEQFRKEISAQSDLVKLYKVCGFYVSR